METLNEKARTFAGDRRSFLRNAGVGVLATAFIMSCKKKKEDEPVPQTNPGTNPSTGVNLGSGDVGILNYAYALEQLEAAFYTRVVTGSFTGTNPSAEFQSTFTDMMEQNILIDLMAHEIAHREAFKALLGKDAIQGLTPNFSAIDFKSRTSVLTYAKTFEDLGVGAYNGAGKLISNADYLVLAGKIVSVEARHASAIRDLLNPKAANASIDSFSSSADSNGLDYAYGTAQVLTAAQPFIVEKINGNNLPKA